MPKKPEDPFAAFLKSAAPAKNSPPVTPVGILPLLSPTARTVVDQARENLTPRPGSNRFPVTLLDLPVIVTEDPRSGVGLEQPSVLGRKGNTLVYRTRCVVVSPHHVYVKQGRTTNSDLMKLAFEEIRREKTQVSSVRKQRHSAPKGPGGGAVLTIDARWYGLIRSVSDPRERDVCPECIKRLSFSEREDLMAVMAEYAVFAGDLASRVYDKSGSRAFPPLDAAIALSLEFTDDLADLERTIQELHDKYNAYLGPVMKVPNSFALKKNRFPTSTVYACMTEDCQCVWVEKTSTFDSGTETRMSPFHCLSAVFKARSVAQSLPPSTPAFSSTEEDPVPSKTTKRKRGKPAEDGDEDRASKRATPLRASGSIDTIPPEPSDEEEVVVEMVEVVEAKPKKTKAKPKKKAPKKKKAPAKSARKKAAAPKKKSPKKAAPKKRKKKKKSPTPPPPSPPSADDIDWIFGSESL
jgi:hypothetical protein